MSLFKLIGNVLQQASGRTQVSQNQQSTIDSQRQRSGHLSEQKDPACALRQAIRELDSYNGQEFAKPSTNQQGSEKKPQLDQTAIQLANWGTEKGKWGQRYAA